MSVFNDKNIEFALRCPICNSEMQTENDGRVLSCRGAKRHAYDFASGGYVNLAPPTQSNGGDSKGAVRARTAFLDTESYAPVAQRVCELLAKYIPQGALVADAGCGEGYYSNAIAASGFSMVGFDLSKFAADAAAKRAKRAGHENAFFGVASVFSLPLADASCDAVVNIFAPCAEEEYNRVLKNGGVLIVVHAGGEHLLGLKRVIYTDAHKNEARADLPQNMALVDESELKYDITVNGNENIKNLFAMTPYYWKTSPTDVEKLNSVDTLNTEVHMIFSVYKTF